MIPKATYRKILELVPIVCVDLVIVNKNKCLLVKRNNEPAKGQYWFPGGRVYKMETIEKAALRKAREEVNLRCKFQGIISIEQTIFPDILSSSRSPVSNLRALPFAAVRGLGSRASAKLTRRLGQRSVSGVDSAVVIAHDPSCAVHSVNLCCKLKPLSLKSLKVDSLHLDPIWVDLKAAKGMKLHPAVIGPISKCLALA